MYFHKVCVYEWCMRDYNQSSVLLSRSLGGVNLVKITLYGSSCFIDANLR